MAQQRYDRDHRSTVEVLRDTRRTTAQTTVLATDTNEQLARQGEQIERMHGKVDKIEAELTMSDKILKSMSGFTGMVTSLFSSSKKPERAVPPSAQPALNATPVAQTPSPAAPNQDRASRSHPPTGITREEDELLDGITSDLVAIRALAGQQRESIAAQNARLDALQAKTTSANNHMERTRNKITTIS